MKRHPAGALIISMYCMAMSGIETAWADVISMNDGMVINGKMIRETAALYRFTNSYGTFNITKDLVKSIYITGSYTEDIAILKGMGVAIDENIIRRNVQEGIKRKEMEDAEAEKKKLAREKIEEAKRKQKEADAEKRKKKREEMEAAKKIQRDAKEKIEEEEKEKEAKGIPKKAMTVQGAIEKGRTKVKPDYWYFGRLGLEGIYYSTLLTRSLYGKVPHGPSLQLTYDQGLDALIRKRNPAMPGLRFEIGYIDYEKRFLFKSSQRISGYTALAGLMWALPSLTNSWGCLVFSLLAGAGYLDIINRDASARTRDFHIIASGIFGYEYSFKSISLFIHLRYMYLYDKSIAFHAIGASTGFTCRLW